MLGIVCVYAQLPRNGMSQGGTGRNGELLFFLLKKQPMVLRELVRFGPSIPVEASESMCLGWVAHDCRGGLLADGQRLLLFVEQLE